jgi:hypothetical protein
MNNNMTMKILLHKDIKEIASRTNGTFGFAPSHKPTLRKTKKAIFCQRTTNRQQYEYR